jgi:hypothetical protein
LTSQCNVFMLPLAVAKLSARHRLGPWNDLRGRVCMGKRVPCVSEKIRREERFMIGFATSSHRLSRRPDISQDWPAACLEQLPSFDVRDDREVQRTLEAAVSVLGVKKASREVRNDCLRLHNRHRPIIGWLNSKFACRAITPELQPACSAIALTRLWIDVRLTTRQLPLFRQMWHLAGVTSEKHDIWQGDPLGAATWEGSN